MWRKFSFWDKTRMLLGSLGIGSEVTLYLTDSYPKWKVVAAVATLFSIFITYFFKDQNGNGEVDIFETT